MKNLKLLILMTVIALSVVVAPQVYAQDVEQDVVLHQFNLSPLNLTQSFEENLQTWFNEIHRQGAFLIQNALTPDEAEYYVASADAASLELYNFAKEVNPSLNIDLTYDWVYNEHLGTWYVFDPPNLIG